MTDTTWREVPFESIYSTSSRNGLSRPKRVRGIGYKMVNMGELFKYRRIENQPMELVPMNAKELENFTLKEGDLLFARQSLVASGTGKCSIVLRVPETTTFESHLIRVRLDSTSVIPSFYFYYFESPQGKANIQSLVMQVAAAGIRGSELQRLSVPVPPKQIQKNISEVLSAFDDLIENNTRRIQILEEMAQRIYREWFVHFRYPGHDKDKQVDSGTELGMIPEGWSISSLGEIAEEHRTTVSPKTLPPTTPCIGLEHMPRKSITLSNWGMAEDVESNKLQYFEGDILFGKIRPYFHKVGIALNDGICSTDTFIVRGKSNKLHHLVLAIMSSKMFVDYTTAGSQGTKMPRANWNVMTKFDIVIPPNGLLETFSQKSGIITSQLKVLAVQIHRCTEIRDLLLPKLISGQIDVSDLDIDSGDMS